MRDRANDQTPAEREPLLYPDPPFGTTEDSPMDEGGEPNAVHSGELGDIRAGESEEPQERQGTLGGPVEPTGTQEAGPGVPFDPAPPRRTFPNKEPDPGRYTGRSEDYLDRRGDEFGRH